MLKTSSLIVDVIQSVCALFFIINNFKYWKTNNSTQFLINHVKAYLPGILIFIQIFKIITDFFNYLKFLKTFLFPQFELFDNLTLGVFENKHLIKAIKNTAIECVLILLFCRRQFSAYACVNFGIFMLSKTFTISWIEKFKEAKEIEEDSLSLNLLFSYFPVIISAHFCQKISRIFTDQKKKRVVDLIIGNEVVHMTYLLKSLIAEKFLDILNKSMFFDSFQVSESLSTYVCLSLSSSTFTTQYSSLAKSYVTNKAIFRYYLLSKMFLTIKDVIIKLSELSRIRKTRQIIELWMKNPTLEELEEQNEKICVICRDEMSPCSSKILSCGHIFHIKCLKNWLKRQYCCPTCLSPISSGSFYSFVKNMDNINPDIQSDNLNACNALYGLNRNFNFESDKKYPRIYTDSLPSLSPDLSVLFSSLSQEDSIIIKEITTFKKIGDIYQLLNRLESLHEKLRRNFFQNDLFHAILPKQLKEFQKTNLEWRISMKTNIQNKIKKLVKK